MAAAVLHTAAGYGAVLVRSRDPEAQGWIPAESFPKIFAEIFYFLMGYKS